jgi:hypothetical protein
MRIKIMKLLRINKKTNQAEYLDCSSNGSYYVDVVSYEKKGGLKGKHYLVKYIDPTTEEEDEVKVPFEDVGEYIEYYDPYDKESIKDFIKEAYFNLSIEEAAEAIMNNGAIIL